MDILNSLRHGNLASEESYDSPKAILGASRPQTVSELLDGQIAFHTKKIADLKEAKAAISPEVERALNALAKL